MCVGGLSCVCEFVFECCLCRLRVYLAHFVVCYCLLLLLALLIAANDRNIENIYTCYAHTHRRKHKHTATA